MAGLGPVPGDGAPAGALSPPEPDAAWVTATYVDVFERVPTSGQNAHRVGQLRSGRSLRSVADELIDTDEHRSVTMRRLYARILDRFPDEPSRTYWMGQLEAGVRVSTVASFLYGSPELYADAGGTAADYVTFLYRDILGREPDAPGAAYWTARIEAGGNRTRLARDWLLTPEATGLQATLMFLGVLHRPPSPAERATWSGHLRRVDERRVLAALVSSPEAYRNAGATDRSIRLTGGDATSREPSFHPGGRIIAFTSAASDLTGTPSPPGDDVFVFDRRTGRLRAITAGNGPSSDPFVSPDGGTVVFQSAASNLVPGDDNGVIDVFSAPTGGGPVTRITDGEVDSTDPVTSTGGQVIAFTAGGQVHVHTVGGGTEQVPGMASASTPDLSADGSTLVFTGQQADPAPAPSLIHLARLPLTDSSDLVPLSERLVLGRPTVSADGTKALFVEAEFVGPSYLSTVVLATVGPEGVTERQMPTDLYKPQAARLGDAGGDLLASGFRFDVGAVTDSFHVDANAGLPGPFPDDADLTSRGTYVVASRSGQIRLYGDD